MRKRTYTPEQAERRQKRNAIWQKNNPDKMRGYYRRHDLKRYYGITPEAYAALLDSQGGVCAICKAPPRDTAKGRLAVDHDHGTTRNRGLLCTLCNHAIERFEKDPDFGDKVLNYLARYIEQTVKG